jgi:hypothetical protein
VGRVEFNRVHLAFAVGVNQARRHQILRAIDGAVVTEREGTLERGISNRAPKVDDLDVMSERHTLKRSGIADLEAALHQQRRILGGQMAVDASFGRRSGLIDMNLAHRLPLIGRAVELAGPVAAEGCKRRVSQAAATID